MNEKETGLLVAHALTNSEAYQNYNIAKITRTIGNKDYYDNEIRDMENNIRETSENGITYLFWVLYYKTEIEIDADDNRYVTKKQVESLIEYFQEKGYFIQYDITKYELKVDDNNQMYKTPQEMTIHVDWSFGLKEVL